MKTKTLLIAITLMSIFSINASAQRYVPYNNNAHSQQTFGHENYHHDDYQMNDRRDEERFHGDHDRYYENRNRHERDFCRERNEYGRDRRILVSPVPIFFPGRRTIREILF